MAPEPGLRAQKKIETRAALSRAALDLAIRDGYDAVTVDAIAHAAHVSTRTFRNYFSSKEDAILSILGDIEQRQADAFLARDADEPVLDSLEAAAIDLVESGVDFAQAQAVSRVITGHPALIAHAAAVHHRASEQVLAEIGRRLHLNPDTDILPRLLYHAGRAVSASVVELVTHGGQRPNRAATLMRQGFSQLRDGLRITSASATQARAK
jgi:AcrR family transcriptional regulator